MRWPSFIGGSYQSQSLIVDIERTMNFYPEVIVPTVQSFTSPVDLRGAKNQIVLYPTPGQQAWLSVSDIGARGLLTVNGRTHGVIGTTTYEFLSTATATSRGTVLQDTNPAQLSYNGASGNSLCLSSGAAVYSLNLTTNALAIVTGVPALQVGTLDGYCLAFDPVTAKVRLSNLNDATTWDPTQYMQRSTAPDPWKAMITADRTGSREVWMIGEHTGDVYYDAGTFPFPLAPIPGAIFNWGTPAPWSLAAAGGEVIWLGQNADGAGVVVAARGYTPQPISTRAVETAIATYRRTSTIADAEALTYLDQGHLFYCLKFPTANATWVCDRTTGLWHERGTWNAAQNRFDAWHPRVHTDAFGMHIVGEAGTGQLSSLDVTFGNEADGSAIRRLRIAPSLFSEHKQAVVRRLELMMEMGLGTATGQGSNPMVMLRVSRDGGKTWGNQRTASAGKIGQYLKRATWTRLGLSRDLVIEISVTDPIPWRFIDCYVNHEGSIQL